MTCIDYRKARACVRLVRHALYSALCVSLIVVLLASQTPALPRPLSDVASDLRNDFKFWLHSSGWTPAMRRLMSQSSAAQPEMQSDRTARVTHIKLFPGDVTIRTGVPEFFDALAYDAKGQQVGGVKFTWVAEDDSGKTPMKISPSGEFVPPTPGSYRIIAEGAGQTAQLIVRAVDGPVTEMQINVVEEPGPGWNPGNSGAVRDPGNERGDPPGKPKHHGAGTGNFQFSAPVLSLPGRGVDLSLNLVYNSRVWTKSNSEIIYDIDRDWPAAGWSLGFGRIAGLGNQGAMLIDADGTRHGFAGTVTQVGAILQFAGHTTDGTFIDYTSESDVATGEIFFAQAQYPNGTRVRYAAPGRGAVYAKQVTDANGNFITIQYKVSGDKQKGPKILFINDTLGRTINFHYELGKLTAITAPGLSGGGEREVVRFLYTTMTLNYAFSGLTPNVYDPEPRVLKAIYYPGTATGYWFGDSGSYSSYGMLAKYSEQRGMTFSSPSLDIEGTVTAGTITRQAVYNYPLTPDNTLTDAPTYSTMTETWAGMDTAAAVTQYVVHNNSTPRNTTITFPDLTQSVQLSFNAPNQYNDGYLFEDSTYDSNNILLRRSTVTWQQGDYGSARPVRIEAFDDLNQKTAAEFSYAASPPFNQVTEVRDFDYGGTSLLRKTIMQYRNSTDYTNQHIFNLMKRVDVWNPSQTVRLSRTDYNHDEPADSTMVNTPGVVQHEAKYDPYDPGFYDPATHFRGNVTSVVRYADANNLTGAITETRTFDITGNVVTASTSCCEQMSFGYTSNTQFAFPETQTRGSADPLSPARISTSAIYDFNTGLTTFVTDANGRQSQASYFPNTLRPQTLTMPTGAYQSYAYDDSTMSIAETVSAFGGAIASQNTKLLNGLGQVKQESALGQNSVLDYVNTQYDAMGRTKKQTRPYRIGDTQQWTEMFYDALGRVFRVQAPDGSESNSFFNETSRPSSASTSPGQTTRVADAWGRERWARLDADGRLAEVVEPNPAGNGTVGAAGNLVTTYSYDILGNLTLVNQGAQQRSFKYDSLRRMTNQKLAEESATLNDSGQYVGGGTWSEAFTYDERSNLITQTDARGVKTTYSYNSDPLNRLQSVTYDIDPSGDTAQHLILPAAGVTFEYVTSGDKTRLFRVTTTGLSTDEYGYDSEGRPSSRTFTVTSRPGYPLATNSIYDSLNRVTDVQYPAQYGMAGNPRKVVHQDFDVSSRLTGLKVDNADYASQIVYNASSQTTSLKVGASGANQITESYTYADTTGLLTNQKVQRGVTTLADLSYDYLRPNTSTGRTGQLTKILNNLSHSRDRGYVYDALGRLTTATGGQPASWTQQYVYDRYGNRTSVTATGTTGGTSLSPPTNLTATTAAGGNSITLNWTASQGAHHYQIERRTAGNPAFQPLGTSTSPSYPDSAVTSGAAYVYRVRAADAQNNLSGSSNARLGVAIAFTDPTLLSGITLVKAAHVTELRQAVNAVRLVAGLPQASWTDATLLGLPVRAVHVEELRTALTPALQALSLTVPGFTDAQLFGVIIKKLHIEELRAGVNASGPGDSGGGSSPIPVDGLASASYNSATNRINSAGWEYDAAGNQTRVQRSDGAWQRYVYDAAGRLVKVQNDSNITQLVNTYGASNHRLIEQVGNESSNQRTYYGWAGDSVIAEYEETATLPTTPKWVKSYVYLGGRLLATIAPNGQSERVEYHHPDRLGTRLVTNNQDTSSFEQAALPFGTALDAESTGSTKRRFTSYDRSTVSGLDYAVNRHYDPLQGRFTQVDPIGMSSTNLANPQTLNLYAYCANDPINQTDPSGLGFWSFLGKVFSFFAKVAKWVAIVVAVVVIVAAALQVGFAIQFLPVLADVLSNLGILSLAGVGPLSFAAGGAAGVGIGATGIVIAGLGAVGAVNSFMAKKSKAPPKDYQKIVFDIAYKASLLLNKPKCRELLSSDITNSLITAPVTPSNLLKFYQRMAENGQLKAVMNQSDLMPRAIAQNTGTLVFPITKFGPRFFRASQREQILTALHELGHATGAPTHYGAPETGATKAQLQRELKESMAYDQRIRQACF